MDVSTWVFISVLHFTTCSFRWCSCTTYATTYRGGTVPYSFHASGYTARYVLISAGGGGATNAFCFHT